MRSFRYASALVLAALGATAPAQTYRITDLGSIKGTNIGAVAINASGTVVGNSRDAANVMRAFVWANGVRTELPAYGGRDTYATDINASGRVVGSTGWTWFNGSFQAVNGEATGINDAGAIALNNANGAAIRQNGTTTYLPHQSSPSGLISSRVNAINNLNQAVGSDLYDPGMAYGNVATFWSNGVESRVPNIPFGTLSNATALNDTGLVVGYGGVSNGDYFNAFVWNVGNSAAQSIEITGYQNSQAFGVNNLGTVVGTAYVFSESQPRAFVYRSGQATILDSLLDPSSMGWLLTDARGINDSGQIVGTGTFNGQTHAFLATPVPEPATMAALGLAAFAALRRRRR